MKQITKTDIKQAISDRWWLGLVVGNIVLSIVAILVIIANIAPKETLVITHYSSFGITGYYRGAWYHLYSYAVLVLAMGVGHALISLKLIHMNRRSLALSLLWVNMALIIVAMIFALKIARIAALG